MWHIASGRLLIKVDKARLSFGETWGGGWLDREPTIKNKPGVILPFDPLQPGIVITPELANLIRLPHD